MLAIFYNKTSLKDTLIIQISAEAPNQIIQKNNFTYGLSSSGDPIFINIFNFSKLGNEPSGYLMLDSTINGIINKHLNIDLTKHSKISPFVIGHVVACQDIPNSHLHECKVNIGDEVLPIVCGAKNIRNDINVIVAKIGATMPNGLVIKKNKILGKESYGMICSARELSLSKHSYNADGIIELDNNLVVGDRFSSVFVNSRKE
jgi:tRNA-binding protein